MRYDIMSYPLDSKMQSFAHILIKDRYEDRLGAACYCYCIVVEAATK